MQSKNRVVKGSKVPSINLSKEILSLLIRLENSELKEIMVGIRDYVYKDKEPSVSEDVEDIMDMVLDNVNYIASKHLNGSKGGKTKKNKTQSSLQFTPLFNSLILTNFTFLSQIKHSIPLVISYTELKPQYNNNHYN